MKKIELSKEKKLSDVVMDSLAFCLQNFGKYSLACIYFILPPILIASLFFVFTKDDFITKDLVSIYRGKWPVSGSLYCSIAAAIFYGIALLAHTTMICQYMILYDRKEDPGLITIREIGDGIRNNIGYTLYSCIWYAVIIIVIGGFMLFIGRTIGLGMGVGPIIVLFLMYFIVVIAPFFIVRSNERLGPVNAIIQCFRLAYGYWWRSLIVMFLFGLIVSAFQALYSAIINGISNKIGDQQIITNVLNLLSIAVATYLSAILYFAIGVNYFSLYRANELSKLRDEPYRYIPD